MKCNLHISDSWPYYWFSELIIKVIDSLWTVIWLVNYLSCENFLKVKAAPNIDFYHLKFCYSWKNDLLHKQFDRHFWHRDIRSIIYQLRAVDDNLDACMCILIASLKSFHFQDKSEKYHVDCYFAIVILAIQLLVLHAGYSLLALWKTVSKRLLYWRKCGFYIWE